MKQRTLIFFGAHPDDESFGPGTTLALYALRGVRVIYVCSTGGEMGTVAPELLKGYKGVAELRADELARAAKELGLAKVIKLGYRDSGMAGSPDNKHPDCLAAAHLDKVVEKMVGIIRREQPDVIVTHDAGGGYGHPDHIATHNAVVKAFHAAADSRQYPTAGPAFQPSKLYFSVRPRGLLKLMVRLMPLFGQDPHHFGRNRDIDMTKTTEITYPIHAVIRLTEEAQTVRAKAAACHVSQLGGQPRGGPWMFRFANAFQKGRDFFMREYPKSGRHENDLFAGIK
jgi:LmbE family N-acetylglucosaminyl deacetylase